MALLQKCQVLTSRIRERNPDTGLPGLHAMAFPRGDGTVEIACNVNLIPVDDKVQPYRMEETGRLKRVFTGFYVVPFAIIEQEIRKHAEDIFAEVDVPVLEASVLVGYEPQRLEAMTLKALREGQIHCCPDSCAS